MPDVKMPDGTIIRNVPEGTTKAQLLGRVQKMKAGEKTSAYNKSAVGQFLSGTNEGIAGTLGAPVDIMNQILGLGYKGINAVAGTNLQPSDRPVLGSEMIKDWLTKSGSIGPQTAGAPSKFIRRVGQSFGSAVVPVAGTAGPTVQGAKALIPAITGGIGAATANQIAPGSKLADLAGDVLGSVAGGAALYGAGRASAQRKIEDAVPTVEELKQQAADLYSRAEANGVTASQAQTSDLYKQFRDIAQNEGLISPTGRVSSAYPRAKEALDLASDYSSGAMSPTQMQTVRKVLADAAGSTDNSERRIARAMLGTFDDWAAPLAPELAQARSIARRYINAGKIDDAMDLAASRAGQYSGSGYENALRTEFRALDRKIIKGQERGFDPATVDAIEKVSRGTPTSNIMRGIGKAAPTGAVSAGLSAGVPFMVGNAFGGPFVGATLGAGTSVAGMIGRNAATQMGIRNSQLADAIARNGGALASPNVIGPEQQKILTAFIAAKLAEQNRRNTQKK